MVAACAVLVAGCGGTLEGKYRRGQLTTTTTAGPRAPGGASDTSTTTTVSTSTTVPMSGNAAGQRAGGEPEGSEPGGSIGRSVAARRAIVPPLGGRHR